MTCELDTADLNALVSDIFPRLVADGRRSMEEQCVTSATFIAARTQKAMAFVLIGNIDRELEVEVFPLTASGRPSKAKKPRKFSVAPKTGVRVPLGVLIVMARMRPDSRYNALTGSRWALLAGILPKGKGTKSERMATIKALLQQMTMGRHSSTHFLQTGWTPAIQDGMASQFYRYNASFGSRRNAGAVGNPGVGQEKKSGNVRALGGMTIDISGDSCVVTTSADIGGEGNETLAVKRRQALIEQGLSKLENEIAVEVSEGQKELDVRFLMKTQGLTRPMVNFLYFQ